MKTATTSCLGLEVPITGVPENLQEGIQVFGGEQQLLDAAVNYIRLHRTNAEVRDELTDRMETASGVKRATRTEKSPTKAEPDRQVEVNDESENEYFKRALAESGQTIETIGPELLKDLAIEFKAQGALRTGGSKKLAKVYTEAAQGLLNGDPNQLQTAINSLAGFGFAVENDEAGKPKVESLAAAIKANRERVLAEADKSLGIAA